VEAVGHLLRFLEHVVPKRRRGLESIGLQLSEIVGCEWRGAHRLGNGLTGRQAPGELAQQVALRQRLRPIVTCDCFKRQLEQRRGILVSIRLLGFTSPSPKSKKVCQPIKQQLVSIW